MGSREIELWLDERWEQALRRELQGKTVEEYLGQVLEDLCRSLPEYEAISREITAEQERSRQEAEAAKQYSVFEITEQGKAANYLVERPLEFLDAARLVRSYLRGRDTIPSFLKLLRGAKEIPRAEFDRLVDLRLENTGKVTGAFCLDFDQRQMDALSTLDGWYTYRMEDVSAAAFHADRRINDTADTRWERFLDRLNGKELRPDQLLPENFLHGSRPLCAKDISFAGDIVPNGHLLEFYMEPIFDVDAVFGTNVCTTKNNNWLCAYANYDLERGCVYDTLIVDLVFTDGSEQECRYRLSPEEQALLLPKMDAYCVEQIGMDLKSCVNQYRSELSNQWGQQSSQTI